MVIVTHWRDKKSGCFQSHPRKEWWSPECTQAAWLQTYALNQFAGSTCSVCDPLSSPQPVLLTSLHWQSSANFHHPQLISLYNHPLLKFTSYFIPSVLCCSSFHFQALTLWVWKSRKKNLEADPFHWHFMHSALPTSLTSFPSLSPRPQHTSHMPFFARTCQAHTCFKVMPSALFPGMFSPQTLAPSQVCLKGTSPPLLIPYHLTLADFLLGMLQYLQFYNLFISLFIISLEIIYESIISMKADTWSESLHLQN